VNFHSYLSQQKYLGERLVIVRPTIKSHTWEVLRNACVSLCLPWLLPRNYRTVGNRSWCWVELTAGCCRSHWLPSEQTCWLSLCCVHPARRAPTLQSAAVKGLVCLSATVDLTLDFLQREKPSCASCLDVLLAWQGMSTFIDFFLCNDNSKEKNLTFLLWIICRTRNTYLHLSRRSGIPSCWTTVVEQPSVQPSTVRPYPRRALKTYLFGWLRL